ncbi:MAG TPA: uroporphyrinogen decarboxylase family protein [bacterium]|jgi:hypothetical protein|nr:uroporphyrinogen decarboxylase family protein [bacterium]
MNDAIIQYFSGGKLDGSHDEELVMLAASNCLDATREIRKPDTISRKWRNGQGNLHESARWTDWIIKYAINEAQDKEQWIRNEIERLDAIPIPSQADRNRVAREQHEYLNKLGDLVYIHCTPGTAFNTAVFGYLGLETFSYLLVDNRDLLLQFLRALERARSKQIELTAHKENCSLAMIYSDIAYHGRLMLSKESFSEIGFFDDVASICSECHKYGLQVIFHSDGYIMDIVPDLVAAGIDGLNPIEKAAGMDIYELRKQYPELIIVGGLDVTHLLPFGTPEEVRSETRKIINEIGSEGRLLLGSTTEIGNDIPLDNYLAFHDEVMQG